MIFLHDLQLPCTKLSPAKWLINSSFDLIGFISNDCYKIMSIRFHSNFVLFVWLTLFQLSLHSPFYQHRWLLIWPDFRSSLWPVLHLSNRFPSFGRKLDRWESINNGCKVGSKSFHLCQFTFFLLFWIFKFKNRYGLQGRAIFGLKTRPSLENWVSKFRYSNFVDSENQK